MFAYTRGYAYPRLKKVDLDDVSIHILRTRNAVVIRDLLTFET
jgi:hypothetical protein